MDEVSNLKSQLADATAKNTALTGQLKNALEGKVDDVKEFMSNLSIQDGATAKIQELTAQNQQLQGIVSQLQEKVQGLTGMAGGAQSAVGALMGGASASAAAGASGAAEGALDNAADQASENADAAAEQAAEAAADAQEQAEEAAAEAAAEAEKAAEEAKEKAEEAAAAAASAVGNITSGFGW